jgi:hypothetical protein
MEPEGSLPNSEVPATCLYPQPDQSSPCHTPSLFLKIHLHIILPSTPGFSKWSLSLKFPYQNPDCVFAIFYWPNASGYGPRIDSASNRNEYQ